VLLQEPAPCSDSRAAAGRPSDPLRRTGYPAWRHGRSAGVPPRIRASARVHCAVLHQRFA
jgi:hypothetical protein